MLNKTLFVCFLFTAILFSCKKEVAQLYIEQDGKDYYKIMTDDKRILFSFDYNKQYASFPVRIVVPNFDLYNPMMIFIEFDDNLNVINYQVSDGVFFEDSASVSPEPEIYVTHRLRIKGNENTYNEIIYSVKNDGTFEVIENRKLDSEIPWW